MRDLLFTLGARLALTTFIAWPMPASGEDQAPPSDRHEHQHQGTATPGTGTPQPQHNMSNMPHAGHSAVAHTDMNSAGMFLMRETSGTAFQPEAWPMPMLMTRTGDWQLRWMGQAFIVDTQQSGPRRGS